jgi:hypothetical protein
MKNLSAEISECCILARLNANDFSLFDIWQLLQGLVAGLACTSWETSPIELCAIFKPWVVRESQMPDAG